MQQHNTVIRRHARHVTGIPIEVTLDLNHGYQAENESITNVSPGGLCFIASDYLQKNESIQVRFPVLNQEQILDGKVVWCNKTTIGYEVGLEFDDPEEVEHLKMIEQIRQIESFRRDLEIREGRKLSGEQAAQEWVSKYRGDFKGVGTPVHATARGE